MQTWPASESRALLKANLGPTPLSFSLTRTQHFQRDNSIPCTTVYHAQKGSCTTVYHAKWCTLHNGVPCITMYHTQKLTSTTCTLHNRVLYRSITQTDRLTDSHSKWEINHTKLQDFAFLLLLLWHRFI